MRSFPQKIVMFHLFLSFMGPAAEEIEEALKNPEVKNQAELKSYMRKARSMIDAYEQSAYEEEGSTQETKAQIKKWRALLIGRIRENKDLPEAEEKNSGEENDDDKAGVEILRLMNRQLLYASNNQKLLERGTLKLAGLDYSYDEIEDEVEKTRRKISEGRNKEKAEKRNLMISFIIFVLVCLFVLFDKFRAKFL